MALSFVYYVMRRTVQWSCVGFGILNFCRTLHFPGRRVLMTSMVLTLGPNLEATERPPVATMKLPSLVMLPPSLRRERLEKIKWYLSLEESDRDFCSANF